MTNTTSISLLGRIADQGDNSAWTRLLEIYRPFIRQRVAAYPDLRDQIEDITQEVLMVLMRELPTFQRQRLGSFRSFLRTITLNQLRSAARKTRRQPRALGDQHDLAEQIEELADPASIAATEWDKAHDKAVLRKIIDCIKGDFEEKTWKAFQHYGLEKRPLSEVASELEMTTNAVMLAKSRILRRLREEADGLVDKNL